MSKEKQIKYIPYLEKAYCPLCQQEMETITKNEFSCVNGCGGYYKIRWTGAD